MPNTPESAQKALRVASAIGGADGRELARTVEQSLNAPDLREYTYIGNIIDATLGSLGTFNPSRIPHSTKLEMRRDPQIRFGLQAVKSPLIAAPLHFVCRSREVQELLTDVFIKSGFLSELLMSSLNAVEFGFAAHEQIWTMEDERHIEYDEPKGDGKVDVKDKTFTRLFTPQRFKDLDPALVSMLKNNQGQYVGLTFGAWLDPNIRFSQIQKKVEKNELNILRADKTFVFTPIHEFQNIRGEGRLEWTYDSWYWQRICYMVAMRWYERKSDPPYVIYAPNTIGIDAEESVATQTSNLVLASRAVEKLRHSGHVALPSEVFMDDDGRPSQVRAWELSEVKVQDMHPAFLDMIDHFDKKKTRSVFAPDIALARDRQAGTLGSTEAIMDATVTMQNQTLEAWVNHVNRSVIEPFLRFNNIKDKAYLTSTGVLSDNRAALRDVLSKVLEADMLAEQAWGRVFPGSLTQMIDREGLVRELGVPHRPIDPDMEMPVPAPVDGETARDNLSNGPDSDAKRGSGGGTAKPGKAAKKAEFDPFWRGAEGYKMDFASNELVRTAQREAEATEEWVQRSGAEMEARQTLSTYEKAAIAIALWWILRAPKEQNGKRVAGDKSVDALVFSGGRGKVLPAATLAANLPALESKAAALEGTGMTLNRSVPQPILNRARNAMQITMQGLPNEVRQTNLNGYLAEAVRQGQAATDGLLNRFALGDAAYRALAEEAVQTIIRDNTEGLILNIENIARRNAQNMVERFLMGPGRDLGVDMGLVADALKFRFNRLYSDLSLEAHLRAAYRRAHVESARQNGIHFFVKVPVMSSVEQGRYDYVVGSDAYWADVGERAGHPLPHTTFGLHHGSKSYWIGVPTTQRLREEPAL